MLRINELENHLNDARILLIDDSVPFQRLTLSMLKNVGARSVVMASTLAEGMLQLCYNQNPPVAPKFDIVLMDLNLPDGDGMQGCEFISGHSSTYNIPVVVVTGTADQSAIDGAFKAGASDFFQKPLTLEMLKVGLESLLMRKPID